MARVSKTILCVENDRETAKLIANEIGRRGFEVFIAHEGHEGFVLILKGIPEVVLCDVSLPHMSAFEMLERLNELPPQPGRVPFILMTALPCREDELRGRRLGADDYITKPIDFDILEIIMSARLAGVARNEIWPTLVTLGAVGAPCAYRVIATRRSD
jgi:DNA-binding response OmpR family regulator